MRGALYEAKLLKAIGECSGCHKLFGDFCFTKLLFLTHFRLIACEGDLFFQLPDF